MNRTSAAEDVINLTNTPLYPLTREELKHAALVVTSLAHSKEDAIYLLETLGLIHALKTPKNLPVSLIRAKSPSQWGYS